MKTMHLVKHLESERLPELKPWIGKTVEILIWTGAKRKTNRPRNPARMRAVLKARIRQEGLKPVHDIAELLGGWPGKIDDGFEEWVRRRRAGSLVRGFNS